MKINQPAIQAPEPVPAPLRPLLLKVAQHVFWWGKPEDWLRDVNRFAAQVMVFGDWDDVVLVSKTLGESAFRRVLDNPPPGVFDAKSWCYWHHRYHLELPPLPVRRL